MTILSGATAAYFPLLLDTCEGMDPATLKMGGY